MKFYFFKRNIFRQFILYSSLILSSLFTWQMFKDGSVVGTAVFGAIALLLMCYILYQYLSYVRINEQGVTYHALLKEYCLRWEEIGQFKVIPRWNVQLPWIIILRSTDHKDLKRKCNAINRRGECITFAYINEATELIRQKQRELDRATLETETPVTQSELEIKPQSEIKSIPESIEVTAFKRRYSFIHLMIVALSAISVIWLTIHEIGTNEFTCMTILFICFGVWMVVSSLHFVWQIFFGQYSYTVYIGPEGVKFHKRKETYLMLWEDIDRIGAETNMRGYMNKSSMICFRRKGAVSYSSTADIRKFSADFFGVQYRDCVAAVIRRYWDGRIWNIEKVCDKSRVFDQ